MQGATGSFYPSCLIPAISAPVLYDPQDFVLHNWALQPRHHIWGIILFRLPVKGKNQALCPHIWFSSVVLEKYSQPQGQKFTTPETTLVPRGRPRTMVLRLGVRDGVQGPGFNHSLSAVRSPRQLSDPAPCYSHSGGVSSLTGLWFICVTKRVRPKWWTPLPAGSNQRLRSFLGCSLSLVVEEASCTVMSSPTGSIEDSGPQPYGSVWKYLVSIQLQSGLPEASGKTMS